MNILAYRDYREILTYEFERKKGINPKYSLRSFSRDIGLTPSKLSEVLNSKQGLSKVKAESIAKSLGFNALEGEYFSTLVESEHARSRLDKEAAKLKLAKFVGVKVSSYRNDIFKFVASWEHLALLELINTKNFESSYSWIAKRLGITKKKSADCLNRLLKLGLIKKHGTKIKRKDRSMMLFGEDITSRSIRGFHKEVILKSLEAMELVSTHKRFFRSTAIPVSSKELKKANKMIEDFSIELSEFLSSGTEKADSVYYFSTQLFPVTKE